MYTPPAPKQHSCHNCDVEIWVGGIIFDRQLKLLAVGVETEKATLLKHEL